MNFKETRPLYLLAEIADILRSKNGCAWDREQSHQTLKPYLIEEAYELYDAIESDDTKHMKEELGDLLYQIYAHAQIAAEKNNFTIDDVARGITDKLVYRHPHVFGDESAKDAKEVIDRWEKIKKTEKSHRESILDGVPAHLPGLLKAYRVQQKVSRVGFDWEKTDDVVAKIEEELEEFKEAFSSGNREHALEEAGDILFSMANLLRFAGINPEEALQKTVKKFITRFGHIEKRCEEMNREMEEMSLDELDGLWEEAKKQ